MDWPNVPMTLSFLLCATVLKSGASAEISQRYCPALFRLRFSRVTWFLSDNWRCERLTGLVQ